MPGGDRTGPMGMGAMTGRAAGYCAGFGAPGRVNAAPGRGFGMNLGGGWGPSSRGFGGGRRGRRNMFFATGLPGWMRFGRGAAPGAYQTPNWKPDPEIEKQALEHEAQALQSELDFIEKRLAQIKTGAPEKQP